ncbi:MAG TPA: pantoate--beta-alanine ligase [Verrucomicrobiae bacterium]|nr:pantoate--beta-alanine ligase [Verrucomicrobiae bacterium]
MEIIRTIEGMKRASRAARSAGRVTGLVPTMGALHAGHFSLIRRAQEKCASVAATIFVNPTQFGPHEDLAKYPRPFEADREALEKMGVEYLFAPSVEEMYPRGFSTAVEAAGLSGILEGRSRPGHFRGVTTVVLKLLEIARPDFAFFGRKDAQQERIIRRMAQDLNLDAEIVACPIVREEDGLALSSRNRYLDGEDRKAATALYGSLEAGRREIEAGERDAERILGAVRGVVAAEPRVALDYAELVEADSFERAGTLRADCYVLLAAVVGGTRLIDNALVEQAGERFRVTL